MSGNGKALGIVTLTVLLQLVAAAMLKQAAVESHLSFLLPVLLIGLALSVHAVRFVLWGYAHRRWPLSMTYPMTAVFFPLVIVMALAYGEPVHAAQAAGALLVAAGVAWLTFKRYD